MRYLYVIARARRTISDSERSGNMRMPPALMPKAVVSITSTARIWDGGS